MVVLVYTRNTRTTRKNGECGSFRIRRRCFHRFESCSHENLYDRSFVYNSIHTYIHTYFVLSLAGNAITYAILSPTQDIGIRYTVGQSIYVDIRVLTDI